MRGRAAFTLLRVCSVSARPHLFLARSSASQSGISVLTSGLAQRYLYYYLHSRPNTFLGEAGQHATGLLLREQLESQLGSNGWLGWGELLSILLHSLEQGGATFSQVGLDIDAFALCSLGFAHVARPACVATWDLLDPRAEKKRERERDDVPVCCLLVSQLSRLWGLIVSQVMLVGTDSRLTHAGATTIMCTYDTNSQEGLTALATQCCS